MASTSLVPASRIVLVKSVASTRSIDGLRPGSSSCGSKYSWVGSHGLTRKEPILTESAGSGSGSTKVEGMLLGSITVLFN